MRGECDCKQGYRRLDSGKCVRESKCPNYCSQPNEVKYDCFKECAPRTCPNVTQTKNGTCELECQSGVCDCINGYLRNECGVCVPEAQCSDGCKCESKTEKIECINSCNASKCERITSRILYACPTDYCSKTCECIDGYARDAAGHCIPTTKCCE